MDRIVSRRTLRQGVALSGAVVRGVFELVALRRTHAVSRAALREQGQ